MIATLIVNSLLGLAAFTALVAVFLTLAGLDAADARVSAPAFDGAPEPLPRAA